MFPRGGFRPTRRDVLVACFSAAGVLVWSQLNPGAEFRPQLPISPHSLADVSYGKNYRSGSPGPVFAPVHDPVYPDDLVLGERRSSLPQIPVQVPPLMPSTKVLGHAPGWTIFDNLYMHNGTLLIVSDEAVSSFPERRLMTSTGLLGLNTPENIAAREPTELHLDYISRAMAKNRFGNRIYTISNFTLLFNDPKQFIDHYYHFAAELLLGTWRMYAGWLDPNISPRGHTVLPDPSRAIFAHCNNDEWRDYTDYNQYFLHASFPSTGLEMQEDWLGRIRMTQGGYGAEGVGMAKLWRFDRVLLVDRSAAFRGDKCGGSQRTAAEAYHSNKHIASRHWWEPIRRRVLGFASVPLHIMDYSIPSELQEELGVDPGFPPVLITYLSRQGWRRRLTEESHNGLVAAVQDLCDSKGWEFLEFHPENYSRDGQLAIAARSTVIFGVHGNGLTHLIAMAPTPVSAVIEIFYPGGFAKDYQWTAESLGIKHFGVWNDTWFTSPKLPTVNYPEGFQGESIYVHGPTVAQLIADRVEDRLPGPPNP